MSESLTAPLRLLLVGPVAPRDKQAVERGMCYMTTGTAEAGDGDRGETSRQKVRGKGGRTSRFEAVRRVAELGRRDHGPGSAPIASCTSSVRSISVLPSLLRCV